MKRKLKHIKKSEGRQLFLDLIKVDKDRNNTVVQEIKSFVEQTGTQYLKNNEQEM